MTDRPPYPGTPRWVIVSGIVTLVLVLLAVVVVVVSGGNHGPSRHMPSGDAGVLVSPVANAVRSP